MGVYIKSMKMPTNCSECGQFRWSNLRQIEVCRIADAIGEDGKFQSASEGIDNRPAWCPLIYVPEHRDLIDRDEFVAKLDLKRERCGIGYTANAITICMNDAMDMPTIIPAD